MNKIFERKKDYFYFVFRVLIGLGFMLHGIMKISGVMDGKIAIVSLMGLAMMIETIGGLFIVIGLFTRTTASIAALEMLYAFFMVHVKTGGINPLANNGEPAMLYFAAFLVLASFGARKWCIDRMS